MKLRELKIFRDLAHEKNFVRAAYKNFVTQPSVSACLKHLEEEIGVKLFERVPRKVTLTKAGERLLPPVEEFLNNYENLKAFVSRLQTPSRGDVRVATVHSIGIYELTPMLKMFMRAYPDIQIHLQYRPSADIYDLVLKKEVDVGLVAYPHPHPKLQVRTFAKDSMVLIVPPGHRLAKHHSVSLEGIRGEKFIAFNKGVPTHNAIEALLIKKGVSVLTNTFHENIVTLKRAVEVGLGISIVPSKTVQEEVKRGTLKSLPVRNLSLTRPLGVLTLKDCATDCACELFTQMLFNGAARKSRLSGKY